MKKTITVFGSSKPEPGEPEYELAYRLGLKLAGNNFNVCTGGYQGIMDAVSKGASEKGAEAIGITADLFGAEPSKHLTKQIECESLFERISKLIEIADGYIILNGGTGTLLELSVVWEYANKGLMKNKPICCLGRMWQPIVNSINERMRFERRREGIVKFIPDLDECVDYISLNL